MNTSRLKFGVLIIYDRKLHLSPPIVVSSSISVSISVDSLSDSAALYAKSGGTESCRLNVTDALANPEVPLISKTIS